MSDDNCLDVEDPRAPVKMFLCHPYGGNLAWTYDYKTLAIKHIKTGRCLENLIMMKNLVLRPCNGGRGQQWLFHKDFKWQSHYHIETVSKRPSLAALPAHDNVETDEYLQKTVVS